MDDRIPTEVIVAACLRKCSALGVPAYVIHKGDPVSGTIIVKIVMPGGKCKLQSQSRDIDGKLQWGDIFDEAVLEEKKADDYINRNISRDSDGWIVEIENRDGSNYFSN